MHSSTNIVLNQHLVELFRMSLNQPNNHSQQYVYQQLAQLEKDVNTYLQLIQIFRFCEHVDVRKMAGLTFKAALHRNVKELELTPQYLQAIRQHLIEACKEATLMESTSAESRSLESIRASLISFFATLDNHLDYSLLKYLIDEANSGEEHRIEKGLKTLATVLEDLRFDTENYQLFNTPEFLAFAQAFFSTFAQTIHHSNPSIPELSLFCMNFLIPQLANHSQYLIQYTNSYLLPLLAHESVPESLFVHTLEGLSQIMTTYPKPLLENKNFLRVVVQHFPCSKQARKKWVNLVLDIIDSEMQENIILSEIESLIKRLMEGLAWTAEDGEQLKVSMEEQANPYEDENEDIHVKSGYTLRTLCVMCLERLVVTYTQETWKVCTHYIQLGLSSHVHLERECGCLLVGIMGEKIEDYEEHFQSMAKVVSQFAADAQQPSYLRCTALWSIQKLAWLFAVKPHLHSSIKSTLISIIVGNGNSVEIVECAFSALGELISRNIEKEDVSEMMGCIGWGLKCTEKKILFSVLTMISTMYEKWASHIHDTFTVELVKQLCQKWEEYGQVEAVVCPLIECLVTVVGTSAHHLDSLAPQLFNHSIPYLQSQHQKAFLLRLIDLLSTLVSASHPCINELINCKEEIHQHIKPLLLSDDRQIRHFGYGLVGDMARHSGGFQSFAPHYAQTVIDTYDTNNLTTSSNALTCLTDLLVTHSSLVGSYGDRVMQAATNKLQISHLEQTYAFNFARVYGRVGNLIPAEGSKYLKSILRLACLGLRARQHQKLTDESYKGLLKMVMASPNSALPTIQYLIESFICYDCHDREAEGLFIQIVKQLKQSMSQQEWNSVFLSKPIFLPAVVKKIQLIACSCS